MDKKILKKDNEELQDYLQFKRRGGKIPTAKGKGSKYNRQKFKIARELKYGENYN